MRQDFCNAGRVRVSEGVMSSLDPIAADSRAAKCELACEVLRSFGGLRFSATGWSMLPAIFPGDTLVVERVSGDQVKVGQVVLVGRDGRLCAHRVVSREIVSKEEDSGNPHRRWITQGDAMPIPDPPVKENELLGRVNYVIRAGRCVAVPTELSLAAKLTGKIARRSFFAARALVYLHRAVPISGKSETRESVQHCQG
jgi:signal peptidase I